MRFAYSLLGWRVVGKILQNEAENYCFAPLWAVKITSATITGADTKNKARKMLGLAISGKNMLPYFITAAPTIDPPPTFNTNFKSSCLNRTHHSNYHILFIQTHALFNSNYKSILYSVQVQLFCLCYWHFESNWFSCAN